MRSFIRRKVAELASRYNDIAGDNRISDQAYISGTTIRGRVTVGDGCRLYKAFLDGNITIGRYSSLWGPDVHVFARGAHVEIGSFCSIARHVSIQEDLHNAQRTTTYFIERNLLGTTANNAVVTKGPILIGSDVWIGAAAHILSDVTVGHGAIIGAGSIVTKDVPPYAIVAGNPAQIVRYRFHQAKIDALLDSSWWDWPLEKIRENPDFLTQEHDRP